MTYLFNKYIYLRISKTNQLFMAPPQSFFGFDFLSSNQGKAPNMFTFPALEQQRMNLQRKKL